MSQKEGPLILRKRAESFVSPVRDSSISTGHRPYCSHRIGANVIHDFERAIDHFLTKDMPNVNRSFFLWGAGEWTKMRRRHQLVLIRVMSSTRASL